MKYGILLFPLLFLVGCGPQATFSRAQKLEEKGRYYDAWQGYQKFVAKYPKHELAPEALFRAGWMAQEGLNDCYVADTFYDKLLADYPQSEPWSEAASLQQINCPDYFPLIVGSEWVEGDSESKGQIAKTIIKCKPLSYTKFSLPSKAAEIEKVFYAGKKKFRSVSYIYKKENNELLEFVSETDSRAKTLLKWPLEVGTTWRAKFGGRVFLFEIVGTNERVQVISGTFENCLKVKSSIQDSYGARYEYFAPNVGKVLTTLSTPSGEKRSTELISYKINPHPGFGPKKEEEEKSK